MKNVITRSGNPEFDSLVHNVPFTRRAFVISMLGAGFALATQPVIAETVIKTSTDGLVAGEIKVPVSDGDMTAYRAQPDKGTDFPVILVISEIFGVHEHIADICRRLAKLGYLAIAPELFARHGDPRKISRIQDILDNIVAKVPDAQVMSDLDACEVWAKTHGGDASRLAITGFCWGGRITWLYAAHNPRLKAGIAWYGRIEGINDKLKPQQPLDIAAQLKAPVLGLYGGQDQGIPLDNVEAMRAAIQKAGGKSEIHVYPDAPHAFHADYRPSYRKNTADDGWERLQTWLKKNGV